MNDEKLISEIAQSIQNNKKKGFKIDCIQSPNFNKRKSDVSAIIIYCTNTNRISSIISWFQKKISRASSHFIIGRDGRIVKMVDVDKKAWHAGESYFRGKNNVNKFSVAIHLVGTQISGFTDRQYQACSYVCSLVLEDYDIELNDIVSCNSIRRNDKTDLGPKWQWEKFHTYLSERIESSIVDEEPEPDKDELNNCLLYSPDSLMESRNDSIPKNWLLKLIFIILKILKLKDV